MQRRRSQSQAPKARTITAPSIPAVQITYFPKDRPRVITQAEMSAARPPERVGDLDTDPTGERTRRALEQDRVEHPSRPSPDLDALAYHRQKLEHVLHDGAHALACMSQRELMEVAALGHGLYEQGRLDEARIVFEGLVALEPNEAFPYTVLGAIFLTSGDPDRALALFEAALSLDCDDAAALCYRGEIRLLKGRRSQGLADLRRAAELDPPGSPFGVRARAALNLARQTAPRGV